MKTSLLRRMAPLVAGILLAAPVFPAMAYYPYIQNITWPAPPNDYYATVYVATGTNVPTGYAEPRSSSSNYYWFFGTSYTGIYGQTTIIAEGETDSVSVYVYSVDDDMGWASVSRTYGTQIYNGP